MPNAVMPSGVMFGETQLAAHLVDIERWFHAVGSIGESGEVETPQQHDLIMGEQVIIAGSPDANCNGVWTVSVGDDTHFVLDSLAIRKPAAGGYFLPLRGYVMADVPAAARLTIPVQLHNMTFVDGVFDAGNLSFQGVPQGRKTTGVVIAASSRDAVAEIALLYTTVQGIPRISNGLPIGLYWSDGPNRIFSPAGVEGPYIHQDEPTRIGYLVAYYGARARKPAVVKVNGRLVEDVLEIKRYEDGWGWVTTLRNPETEEVEKFEDNQMKIHQVWGYLDLGE